MRRGVLALVVTLTLAALTAVVLVFGRRSAPREPRLVEPGRPLPLDETVRLRFSDEETGEEDVWTVTKRITAPEERSGRPLPEPAPVEEPREPDDSARALQARALESWKQGEIREAMELLEQAIELDPDDRQPRTHYGRLLTMAMDYDAAIRHLERAAELEPDDPQVWLDLMTAYQRSQRLPQSWEARKRAEALADGRAISQEPMGFWIVEGESIYP